MYVESPQLWWSLKHGTLMRKPSKLHQNDMPLRRATDGSAKTLFLTYWRMAFRRQRHAICACTRTILNEIGHGGSRDWKRGWPGDAAAKMARERRYFLAVCTVTNTPKPRFRSRLPWWPHFVIYYSSGMVNWLTRHRQITSIPAAQNACKRTNK